MLGVTANYVGMIEGGSREVSPDSTLAKLFEKYESTDRSGARGKLKAAREMAGLTQAELAKKIGYAIGVLQAVEDGSARASEKMIEKLCEVLPEISKGDLMDGSDHPPIIADQTGTLGQKPKIVMPPGMTARYVPLISWAQAGSMTSFDDEAYEYEGYLAFNVKDAKAIAVSIRGDSMAPQYTAGDVAILYPSIEAKNGDLVIARLTPDKGSDVMFKIFSSTRNGSNVTLSSYNPAFPAMTFDRGDFEWIYLVASVVKNLKH